MKCFKLAVVALATMSYNVSARDVVFENLFASSIQIGAVTGESRSGTNIGVDWSFTDNFAVELGMFDYRDDNFTNITNNVNDAGDVETRLGGRELSLGFKAQHIFYDVFSAPISIYIKAGIIKNNFDDIVLEDENGVEGGGGAAPNPNVNIGADDADAITFPEVDSLYYGVGSRWFLNNRTSIDFSYVIFDEDERSAEAPSSGTLTASLKYAPIKNFGFSLDYINTDVIGERRTGMSVFIRW